MTRLVPPRTGERRVIEGLPFIVVAVSFSPIFSPVLTGTSLSTNLPEACLSLFSPRFGVWRSTTVSERGRVLLTAAKKPFGTVLGAGPVLAAVNRAAVGLFDALPAPVFDAVSGCRSVARLRTGLRACEGTAVSLAPEVAVEDELELVAGRPDRSRARPVPDAEVGILDLGGVKEEEDEVVPEPEGWWRVCLDLSAEPGVFIRRTGVGAEALCWCNDFGGAGVVAAEAALGGALGRREIDDLERGRRVA